MSRVYVHGRGAVSPAGWSAAALSAALEARTPLPTQPLARAGWSQPLPVRLVPPPAVKPAFLAHPRLRRASPAAHYAVSAALEAMGADAALAQAGALRLGIIACTMTGGISYSRRFYQEVLADPATASPLIFPETVFNAPISHLSAYLNTPAVNYTIVGDAGAFLQGAALAAQWLAGGAAEACLLIGAEELDWSGAEALRLFDRRTIYSAGAGALYLKSAPSPDGIELAAVTDSITASRRSGYAQSLARVRAQLPSGGANDLLCLHRETTAAWPDWRGQRRAIEPVLGEAFVAAAAWQCVAACAAIPQWHYEAVNVMVGGAGQQSIGARFVNTNLSK